MQADPVCVCVRACVRACERERERERERAWAKSPLSAVSVNQLEQKTDVWLQKEGELASSTEVI